MTQWYVEHRCFNCNHELSPRQKFSSNGICAHCGYVNKHNSQIAHTLDRVYRWKRPWWQFWIRQKKIYKEE